MAGLLGFGRDTLQAMSNNAAGLLSGPVDLINLGLLKAGLPMPANPVGGSASLRAAGLTRDVQNPYAQALGETIGNVLPIVAAAKGPQIAEGLLNHADAYRRYHAAVTAPGAQVVPASRAKELLPSVTLPADDLFAAAVQNTPAATLTDDGLRLRVMRNQRPEQGLADSVRGGVFYLPEGAAQSKHYATGKSGYGGSERIAGETLVRNPLFVKGATGGKAPEAAYDLLLGKGSYQSMREDAVKAFGRHNAPPSQRAVIVDEFLDKYAPEMSGMGRYIVDNSKQGNQLPYALQEAAVSSAVRSRGHDAVLGYSKGKAGPFLSELFDVRESAYPDKFGGYRLWADQ